MTQIITPGLGQSSLNEMALASNPANIDFHHNSNPATNSHLYMIPNATGSTKAVNQAFGYGNKMQYMKNRKGFNQSIDFRPPPTLHTTNSGHSGKGNFRIAQKSTQGSNASRKGGSGNQRGQ